MSVQGGGWEGKLELFDGRAHFISVSSCQQSGDLLSHWGLLPMRHVSIRFGTIDQDDGFRSQRRFIHVEDEPASFEFPRVKKTDRSNRI